MSNCWKSHAAAQLYSLVFFIYYVIPADITQNRNTCKSVIDLQNDGDILSHARDNGDTSDNSEYVTKET